MDVWNHCGVKKVNYFKGFLTTNEGVKNLLQQQSPTIYSAGAFIQSVQFSPSVVSDSETPWTAARQASLSITNSQRLVKLMSIESVMPSSHLILCHPLLLLPPIPPSIRVFSTESTLHMRWPNYWEFQLQHQSFQWTPRTDLL